MKKLSKTSIFILFITSIIIPILPAIAGPVTAAPVTYRTSSAALIVSGDWDPVITDGYNVLMGSYFYSACEYVTAGYADYWGGLKDKTKEEEWWPVLCTEWETTFRPENETNSAGFNNTGGRESILFTLRENVTFHDGSAWNATVMKWNIDRMYLITGNLTGNANGINDQRNAGTYWNDIVQTKDYWTESWNLSEYDAPNAYTGFPYWSPPDTSRYSYYYLTDPDGPSPVIANNSNPFGGWDPVYENWIHYAPYDQNPLVRWVEIVEDLPSGGKVRVHWNSWNSYGMEGMWLPQISMQAYKDYYETGYYSYNTGNDMIGTGPYIFAEHDEINDRGYMIKNENYWNKTALEAGGWFDVERYEVAQFAPGDLGKDARNIALLDHQIDYAYDSMTMPIDYDAVMADPNINYYEDYVSSYQTQITLNSINETFWAGGRMYIGAPYYYNYSWIDINAWYDQCSADPAANGIPRPLRKALTYAFDYDTLIQTDLNDRAVRGGGLVGEDNIFYNSSTNLPGYNLTYAREVLLATEYDIYSLTDPVWPGNADKHNFSKQLALRGLTDPTDDPTNNALWQSVGQGGNPIFTINFYWDDVHQDLADKFELACNNLGVAIVQDIDNKAPTGTILWDHCIGSYWTETLDGVHSIFSAQAWPMDYDMPMTIPEGWIHANYGDPNRGTWRLGVVTDLWPTWNFGFNYDAEIDYWLAVMYQSEPHRKLEMISKIAEKEQNELFPMIYCYQTKGGEALWANWDTFWVLDRDNRPAGFWGGISPHFLSYTPGAEEYPLIPGAPLLITLSVSAASMIGIVYSLMRKKKLR